MFTQEWIPGIGWVTQDSAFRSYADPAASSSDYWDLLQRDRYAGVRNAPDFNSALAALGKSGYATDPAYAAKVGGIAPSNPSQQAFYDARRQELMAAGAPEHLAELGARQSALETGWGRSAPGQNYYGIKAPAGMQVAQAGRSDVPQGLMPREMPTMSGQQQQQAPMPPQMGGQPPAPMGFGDRLGAAMSNPAFLMGASILANNTGNYGAAAPAIGRGMQQGAALYSGGQEETTQNELRKMQMDVARRRMAQEEQDAAYVEEFVSRLDPAQQRLARAIGIPKYVELLRGGEQPTAYKEFQLGLQNPEFRQYQEDLKRAGAQNISVGTGEKTEDAEMAKLGVEDYKAARATAENSSKLGTIEVMDQLLDQINTGAIQPAATDVKAWADSLGLPLPGAEKLAPAQAFSALANQMTLQARNTANGTGMPGNMSDADRNFLKQMVPGLEKQKGANRMLLDINRKFATREQEIAIIKMNYFDKYKTMRPTTDPTTGEKVSVGEAVRRFINERPLFTPDYVKQMTGGM